MGRPEHLRLPPTRSSWSPDQSCRSQQPQLFSDEGLAAFRHCGEPNKQEVVSMSVGGAIGAVMASSPRN
jgi:hypothetical protein